MKAVGIVASPRMDGNTAFVVGRVLEGTGAEGRVFGMNGIEPCSACMACKGTVRCVKRDGMQAIYEALAVSDLLVVGSPIYLDHISAQAWTFLNRLYCFIGPAPQLENRWRGPRRCLVTATQGRPAEGHYLPQLGQITAVLRKYWSIECQEPLVVGGCRREPDLAARPEVISAALAAGRRLAGR
ncbi:MAG TPA: flavodoxin family protein [Planctomycetota bacterium]|nr:flavodoxin family protein [Planctomycetota bacterium]